MIPKKIRVIRITKPTLIPQWKRVLMRAHSVRLLIIAALLSGLEVALPYFVVEVEQGGLALIVLGVSIAAIFARLLAQKDLENV